MSTLVNQGTHKCSSALRRSVLCLPLCAGSSLVGIFSPITEKQAAAASPSSVDEPEALLHTTQARGLYLEGTECFQAKDWRQAHLKFLQAWNLKSHWQTAGMLGRSELRLARYVDAAVHLTFALEHVGSTETAQKATEVLRAGLAEALTYVASVQVLRDPPISLLFIDGLPRDSASSTGVVYVEPGEHTLEVRNGLVPGIAQTIACEAGKTYKVALVLASSLEHIDAAPDRVKLPAIFAEPPLERVRPPTQDPYPDTRPNAWPIVAGSAAATIGLAMGLGFALDQHAKESQRDNILRSLVPAAKTNACGAGTLYENECAKIASLYNEANRSATISWVGFGILGLATVGTLTYVLWPRTRNLGPSVAVVPSLGRECRGATVSARF